MEKFQLSLWVKIIGIGSASGLVYFDDTLYIISDSSSYLYQYHISDAKLNKIALAENPQENIAKKYKPDFEAIAQKDKISFFLVPVPQLTEIMFINTNRNREKFQ